MDNVVVNWLLCRLHSIIIVLRLIGGLFLVIGPTVLTVAGVWFAVYLLVNAQIVSGLIVILIMLVLVVIYLVLSNRSVSF